MLIHPWDAATSDEEWQAWVATQSVGTLVVPTDDLPVVVPTRFVWTGEHLRAQGSLGALRQLTRRTPLPD